MAPVTVAARALTGLVLVMHVTAMLHLTMLALLLRTSSATDLITIKVYKPQVTSVLYAAGASLHFYALCSVACRRRRSQEVGPAADVVPRRRRSGLRRFLDTRYDHCIIVFNLVEIASECYQANSMFEALVEPSKVLSYAVVVVLNCFGSPLLLFVRNRSAKVFLVNMAGAVVSFTLSCGHPLVTIVLQLMEYVMVNRNLNRDSLWSTQTLLLTRQLVPSDVLHLMAMLALHVGTYLALRRVLHTSHRALASVFVKAAAASSSGNISKKDDRLAKPERLTSIEHFIKLTQQKRVLIRINLVVNLVIGVSSIVLITRSVFARTPCPPYCGALARPLFDLTCNCAFISINCAAQGIQDPLPLLDPTVLGTNALYLELRRCDLASGIPASSLAPFQGLSKVLILFSNMSTWDGPVPAALNHVVVRYSPRLQSVPRVLLDPMSPALIAINLEHCDLRVLPDHVVQSWKHVKLLSLVNVGLLEFPTGLLDLHELEMLNLQGNHIQTLPRPWLVDEGNASTWSTPKLVYFAGNRLDQVPMGLVKKGVFIDLSGNPIAPIPATDPIHLLAESHQILLDETPHCANQSALSYCEPACAPQCYASMVGDYNCDHECFLPSCGRDLGDCDAFEFADEP